MIDGALRFEVGTVLLVLPQGVTLPNAGRMRLTLEPEGATRRTETLLIPFARGEPSRDEAFTTPFAGGVELRALPAGRWRVRVLLVEDDAPMLEVPVGEGIRIESIPYFTGDAALDLRAGETVELRL